MNEIVDVYLPRSGSFMITVKLFSTLDYKKTLTGDD